MDRHGLRSIGVSASTPSSRTATRWDHAGGTFYVDGDEYHGFACGAHGDAISFLMQTEGVNFPIAVALLAGAQGGLLQRWAQDRAAAAIFLSVRRAIAWGDRTSRRCSASAAACWSSGLIMPLGLPSMS